MDRVSFKKSTLEAIQSLPAEDIKELLGNVLTYMAYGEVENPHIGFRFVEKELWNQVQLADAQGATIMADWKSRKEPAPKANF